MFPRRCVSIVLIIAACCATIPAPVSARTSTATEVDMGKAYDERIVATQNLVTDPLLVAWVEGIGERVWDQTARKDVTYSVKILDVPDVNAFSTLGGFIYVNDGLLDFAQSDDELAGVLGHETGHIERRHVLQNQNKATVLDILMTVGSLFAPVISRVGGVVEAGVMAKVQRDDEYQADKVGLMLMTRAGYDPNAMVSFMQHLGAVETTHAGLIAAYLQDHPDVPKRVAALVGYPELDPTVVTPQTRLGYALHDETEARYAVAQRELTALASAGVPDGPAALDLRATEAALDPAPVAAPAVDLGPVRAAVAAAAAAHAGATVAIAARRDAAREQRARLDDRATTIAAGMPDISGAGAPPGSRLEALIANIALMDKALAVARGKTRQVIDGAGAGAHAQPGGVVGENDAILARMRAQLDAEPPSALTLGAVPDDPRTLADVQAADGDLVRALDAERAALALLDVALGDVDAFVRQLARTSLGRGGDIDPRDAAALEPLIARAVTGLDRAAVAASQGAQLYDMARARQREARIDQLGLAASPERYATLRRAIDVRFKNAAIDEAAMRRAGLSPGEVVAASIIAADTQATPQEIVDEAKTTHRSMVDVANARGMQALSLEIFLHLVELDYTDDPVHEARGGA